MAEYISDAEVLHRALDTYGSALQIVVMMEEMSELQKELCKYLRGKYSPANIAEEIADVEIMLEQMKMLFCCADDVHDVRRRKVERLKERLDNGACNQVCKYNTPDRGCVAGELGARCDLTNVAGKRRCAVAGTYIDKMGCLG